MKLESVRESNRRGSWGSTHYYLVHSIIWYTRCPLRLTGGCMLYVCVLTVSPLLASYSLNIHSHAGGLRCKITTTTTTAWVVTECIISLRLQRTLRRRMAYNTPYMRGQGRTRHEQSLAQLGSTVVTVTHPKGQPAFVSIVKSNVDCGSLIPEL